MFHTRFHTVLACLFCVGCALIVFHVYKRRSTMSVSAVVWKKIILFGDSITQFSFAPHSPWGALIADKLQRKCDVLNRGFSGYNTRWTRIILPKIVDKELAQDTVAIVIFLGANDASLPKLNSHQYVPVSEYRENLVHMASYLQVEWFEPSKQIYFQSVGLPKERIIFMGPPPCDVDKWNNHCLVEGKVMAKDNNLTGQYSVACEEAAKQSGVNFVNLYISMMAEKDWQRFLSDGLHLSLDGSMFLFDKLWPLIQKRTEDLPDLVFPDYKQIDDERPETSLQ